ncbi:probable UDP-D-xylose:L-fucose alpha-1,3-D-xylosyltransferase [Coccomyxa sp. Obi]|nr:probable UDP-D-xylose:L-fucose alpha-1,3-D-xylosyltransferase [Coccomyxa sp. Obi]
MTHASKATVGLMTLLLLFLATTDGRPVNSGVESPLLQDKVAAVAVDNKVILTQTSCGYLEFAVNWITHMEALGIKNWLTIAEDETAMRFLEERYPGHAIPASAFTNEALSDGNALYEWGSAAFTKVACARPTYLQLVLDLGYEVLWSDMDAVWLKDFFHLAPQGLDYVGVDDSEVENEQETHNACTGLMYFRPTVRAQQLLSDWHAMCMELNQNNQGAFNRVFSGAGQHRHLDYYIMPKSLYPHGALVELVDYKPSQGAAGGLDPAWLHANYRVGHTAKREFLRDRMVWRADEFIKNYAIPTCPVTQDGIMPEVINDQSIPLEPAA